jgi:hypothetical protein
LVHCRTQQEAETLKVELQARLAECHLEMHPTKTKIVLLSDQVDEINVVLRGHYAYYGVAGNLRSLVKVYQAVERYWRGMLRSRSWAGRRLTCLQPNQRTDTVAEELQALAVL